MGRRTRDKQLRRLAERRAAERSRKRRQRIVAGVVAGALALGGLGVAAAAFLGGEERDRAQAGPSPTPSPSPPRSPTSENVACRGEVPKAADKEKPMFKKPPKMEIDPKKAYTAEMQTSCGTIVLDLFAKETPTTVNNFVFLARQGFYDGVTFHRIIPGFMIQGGDPEGTGSGGPGYQFEDEIVKGLKFDQPGLLAMANSGPDTNGSQFFITTSEPTHLNGKHTIFGQVAQGMDAVREIESRGSGQGTPSETVYIEKVTITER
jgi:cyclophilin family peptidyl-prolyl cis-trans isomerase